MTDYRQYQHLLFERQEHGVLLITINRPEVFNATNDVLHRELTKRLAAGQSVLLEIDLQGARQVRAAVPEALLVFLRPPSWDELVHRLASRGTEDAAVVDRRLLAAREEMAAEGEFDVSLVNDDVEDVCRELVALVGSPSPTEA